MLVLARREGESIHIGDNIIVQLVKIRGNRVTLAINAPREISIVRSELMPTAQAQLRLSSSESANTHLALSS